MSNYKKLSLSSKVLNKTIKKKLFYHLEYIILIKDIFKRVSIKYNNKKQDNKNRITMIS